jgi:YegS/Rv2252/BmrU family lipid kinase
VKVRAILNPRAGLASRRALAALEAARGTWPGLEVLVTTKAGDARDWAREAAETGHDLVLAAGGDGTANEAAWGLLGSPTALGVVPVGSGNGLARALGLPLDPSRAVPALAQCVPRAMDVGMVNGRPFLNVAGAGFDAAVGAAFHDHGQRGGRRGVLGYVRIGLGMVSRYRPEVWRLEAGATQYQGRAWIVAILNGRQYGGGAVMAPGARLDDGLLEVVIIEDAPRLELLLNAPRVFLGAIEGFRCYRRFSVPQLVLRGEGPILYYRDGEPEAGAPQLEVRLLPRALRVLVPPARANDPHGPFSPMPA